MHDIQDAHVTITIATVMTIQMPTLLIKSPDTVLRNINAPKNLTKNTHLLLTVRWYCRQRSGHSYANRVLVFTTNQDWPNTQ